jgi:hypothetical protein
MRRLARSGQERLELWTTSICALSRGAPWRNAAIEGVGAPYGLRPYAVFERSEGSCVRSTHGNAPMDYVYMLIRSAFEGVEDLRCLLFWAPGGLWTTSICRDSPEFPYICSQDVQMDYVHMPSRTCLPAGAAPGCLLLGPWTTFICGFERWCGFAGDFVNSSELSCAQRDVPIAGEGEAGTSGHGQATLVNGFYTVRPGRG